MEKCKWWFLDYKVPFSWHWVLQWHENHQEMESSSWISCTASSDLSPHPISKLLWIHEGLLTRSCPTQKTQITRSTSGCAWNALNAPSSAQPLAQQHFWALCRHNQSPGNPTWIRERPTDRDIKGQTANSLIKEQAFSTQQQQLYYCWVSP